MILSIVCFCVIFLGTYMTMTMIVDLLVDDNSIEAGISDILLRGTAKKFKFFVVLPLCLIFAGAIVVDGNIERAQKVTRAAECKELGGKLFDGDCLKVERLEMKK